MFNLISRRAPVRVRLTLWYLLLMAFTSLFLSGYFYLQLQNNLLLSIDASLNVLVTQTLSVLDHENGQPALEDGDFDLAIGNQPREFALRLFGADAQLIEASDDHGQVPHQTTLEAGYLTLQAEKMRWRIYTQPLYDEGELLGWLQAAQPLAFMDQTLATMRYQLLLGLPLVLFLGGMGGLFLANRALQPIAAITQTAQEIEASDLTRRINYQGAADELGRLANVFDQMLARLQKAFEQERRFTADAAHELRTPLTVLSGKIEVALSRKRAAEAYETTLHDLGEQVERLIRLSTDLLMLTRFDQNKASFAPQPLNLTEILSATRDFLQPLAQEKKQTITLDTPPTLPLSGDEDHLIRLFLNLIDNAIKYTPPAGQISVQAKQLKHTLMITIQDTGQGIAREHLPHLFERFYRIDSDRSRATGGSGLGLALAQQIVHRHQGTIAVESTVGEGSTFTVELPIG